MTNTTLKNLQIAWNRIIYADSTGADCSGADNTVSKALFTQSFPRLKISTDVSAASAAFSISECAYMH